MNNTMLSFNGERTDPVSGAYHLGNGYRAYHPQLMRFTTPDNLSPFAAGGIHPYAYCAGDPINRADPSGHFSWQAGLGIGLGLLGILGAIFSAGTSIAATLSLSAALTESAALVADVTGIASIATGQHNSRASTVLGWLSLAAGMLSLGTGLAAGGWRMLNNETRGLRQRLGNVLHTGLSGDAAQAARQMNRAGLSHSGGTELNGLGLRENIFNSKVYRVDRLPPEVILNDGFDPSKIFRGVPKMIPEYTPALIASERVLGALKFRALFRLRGEMSYVYEIDAMGVKGVSLWKNYIFNRSGLAQLIRNDEPARLAFATADEDEFNRVFNRASEFYEVHLYHQQITPDRIRVMSAEEVRTLEINNRIF
ncbi:RHS repeat-associated core domain-containing protein [Winslowiella toletana]|uniref:RHS repeat-associated core domain-containing protein n=1 Tax=Winslowiella toletana TaxID=92490 RepID=UPI0028BD9AE2|nr:RHS repeat-associated core domain-containing protein [Winslowiella toletana]WNN46343.1 RHS repeat-associated core domain-containing protein [Winslowiella toletana]